MVWIKAKENLVVLHKNIGFLYIVMYGCENGTINKTVLRNWCF